MYLTDKDITTTTVIAHTNLNIDLDLLFKSLNVISLEIPSTLKKKKDIERYILEQNYPNNSIITVQYQQKIKGFKIKKRKQWVVENKTRKYFRNGLTIVLLTNSKLLNFKVPNKGKIQITGCKGEKDAKACVEFLWDFLKQHPSVYQLNKGTCFTYCLVTVMTNIVFKVGFEINREKLDMYMNTNTDFHSLLETSFGYTGVNIKKPFNIDPKMYISQFVEEGKTFIHSRITYEDYFNEWLSAEERNKEQKKRRNNSFLVFFSGSVIMSGMNIAYMQDEYQQFLHIITKAQPFIEEVKV